MGKTKKKRSKIKRKIRFLNPLSLNDSGERGRTDRARERGKVGEEENQGRRVFGLQT